MSMLKNFATVGMATLASRVLGFVRDILIAASVGSGPVADAFFVAFRLPNLFRRLFAEGAFNSAFVPIFAGTLQEEGSSGARRVAEEILAGLLFVLLLFTALAELAMPLMIHLLAPGFNEDPAKFDLAVVLTRITFPYLLCMSVIAFLSGILNSLGKFAAAAFAPVLLNVVLIATLVLILMVGRRRAIWLAIIWHGACLSPASCSLPRSCSPSGMKAFPFPCGDPDRPRARKNLSGWGYRVSLQGA